jgi:hypothetical protein
MFNPDPTGELNMIKLKQIALNWAPPLLAAVCLVQAGDALAGAAADDAQAQARRVLVAPAGAGAPRGLSVPVFARASDAARAARGLLLGSPPHEELPMSVQTLQARVTSLGGARAPRAGRQDAQAQARRLIHGGAA